MSGKDERIEGQMDVYDVLDDMGASRDLPPRTEWDAEAMAQRAAKLEEPLGAVYPEGRTFFYEGDSVIGFIASVKNMFGFDVEVSVKVPADKLHDFNKAAADRGWPLGT